MNYITGKHIPRRTFLRGVGATVALPFLDAMVPARGALAGAALERASATPAGRTRLVCIEEVHGLAGCNALPHRPGALFAGTLRQKLADTLDDRTQRAGSDELLHQPRSLLRRAAEVFAMSRPLIQISPALGFSRPTSVRRRVLFPDPEPPRITSVSPGCTSKLIP